MYIRAPAGLSCQRRMHSSSIKGRWPVRSHSDIDYTMRRQDVLYAHVAYRNFCPI